MMKTQLTNPAPKAEGQRPFRPLPKILHLGLSLCLVLCLLASLSSPVLATVTPAEYYDYVGVEYTETPLGMRALPEITHWKLRAHPAVKEFYAKLEEVIAEQDANIDEQLPELEASGVDPLDIFPGQIMDTRTALEDDILSIAVRYTPLTPGESLSYYHLSLNLDLQTSEKLGYQELLDRAGFTQEDVEFSIREVGSQFLQQENEKWMFFAAAEEDRMPEENDGLLQEGQEEDLLDYSLTMFQRTLDGTPDEMGEIPPEPALFYLGQGRLFLSYYVPGLVGAGFFNHMLPVGNTKDQLTTLATYSAFEEKVLGWGYLSEEAAVQAAMKSFFVDENGNTPDGVHLSFRLVQAFPLEVFEDFTDMTYLIEAFEDLGSHKVNYGWRLVSIGTGAIMSYDPVTDGWDYIVDNFSVYDGSMFMDGQENNAPALLFADLDLYEEWQARPHFTADLPALLDLPASNTQPEDLRMCLLNIVEPDSVVSVEYGNTSGEWGVMDRVIYQETLQSADQLVIIYPSLDASMNHIGVRISNAKGEAFWNLAYLDVDSEDWIYVQYD